jgi:hypothetical protein
MLRGCGEGLESLLDMIEMRLSPELVERIAAAEEVACCEGSEQAPRASSGAARLLP